MEHIGTIKLAHFTVKEYLIIAHANFNEYESSCLIAESCLGYLLQFNTPGSLNDRNIHNFKVAKYAAQYWVQHARDAEQKDRQTEVMKKMMGDIVEYEASFVTWVQLSDPQGHWEGTDFSRKPGATPLNLASFLGLLDPVQKLMQNGADVNAQGGRYGNALQAASYGGYQEIVKLLIHKGANVNAQGGEYGNALQAALFLEHQEIVKLLIEKGADVNAQGGIYGNALQAASYQGQQEFVKLLMDKGADVNAQGGRW